VWRYDSPHYAISPITPRLTLIIHFTGVKGIRRHSLAYKSAYNYTPTLSALIWVGRLLFLEYALPLRPYTTLASPWPSRDSLPSHSKRLEQIRLKYMLRGGFHPLGELFELRAHGKWVVKKDGARANLVWADDGQSFSINDKVIRLLDFTYLYKASMDQVERHLAQALLGWQAPTTDLSVVKDSLTCRTPGWCFLQEPGNELQSAYKALSRRAWTLPALGLARNHRWDTKACMKYLEAGAQLSNDIFVAAHVTAGLPARGTEITSVKVYNTDQVLRNLFVLNGRFMIVFEYNKLKATNHRSFYVVRYLPSKLSNLLYQYLVYVRPFMDFLCTQLKIDHLRSAEFLFLDPRRKTKHLSSTQATAAFRHATGQFPTQMTLSFYRQVSIAIAKRYISKLVQKSNFYEPKHASDPKNVLAFGAGHYAHAHLTSYAIDRAYPTRLQPELLELYRRLSTQWQQWNEQYYRDHRHLWGSPWNAVPGTGVPQDTASAGQKRPSPSDPTQSLGLNKKQASSALLLQCNTDRAQSDSSGFLYNAQYKIIICVSCGLALQSSSRAWYRHLTLTHRILGSECKALVERFETYDLCAAEDLTVPVQPVAAIEGLRVIDGFRCRICPSSSKDFLTSNEKKMMQHVSSEHKLKPKRAKQTGKYSSCFLQKFYIGLGRISYFEVEKRATTVSKAGDGSKEFLPSSNYGKYKAN